MAGPIDLTPVNKGVVTAEAPRSSVTPQQIAAPYRDLADALDKVGEASGALAENTAKIAGANAVTRDDDGNLVVQKAPIIGPASQEYARAARFSYLAQREPEIEAGMTKLRLAHPNDPEAFQAAAKAFSDQTMQGITDPALKGPVQKVLADNAGQNYRSSLVQADATNLSNLTTSLKSQISDSSNKMADLAFQGGVETPEYKTLQSNVGAMYNELASDPRTGYPKARVESEVTGLASQHKTMAIAGQAIRMMDSGSPTGRADAKKWLIDKVYGDPSLNLSLSERHTAVTTAMGLMEARSADGKAAIDANKATTTALLGQLKTGAPYNAITVNDAIANATKIGDSESFYKLTFAKGMKDWTDTIRSLPLPQQIAALHSLDRATPFEGRLIGSESSANPTKVNQLGYAGLYQFGAPRLADIGVYTPGPNEDLKTWSKTGQNAPGKWTGTFNVPGFPQVKTVQDFLASPDAQRAAFGAHREKMDQEITSLGLDKYEGQTVGGAYIDRNALYGMMHLGGAQGTAAALASGGANAATDANGTSVMDYAKKFGARNGAGEAWFNEARIEAVGRTREYLKTQAADYVATAEKMLNKTGDIPDSVLTNVAAVLHETGQDDLRKRMDVALMAHYGVEALDKLPENVRQLWGAQSNKEASDSVIGFQVHEAMTKSIADNIEAMDKTPYSTWATRTKTPAPDAFDFANPQNVAATASKRATVQQSFRKNDGTAPTSVFEGVEGASFAAAITSGDPAVSAQLLNSLSTQPNDVYRATLAEKPVAKAVSGMMSSADPVRMTAAMQAAEKLFAAGPADAETALGGAAMTKMQAWRALKDSFAAPQLAEMLNSPETPSIMAARKDASKAAETEVSGVTASDMAYKMGTSWGIPIVSRVANLVTGATPNAPLDPIKGGELVNDYRTTYAALRAYGVDADKASSLAVERLKSSWQISAAAGNQLMKNAPEAQAIYPSIDGSKEWIAQDLNAWTVKHAGPEYAASTGRYEAGIGGVMQPRNWSMRELISDDQTRSEIAAGTAPSYRVAIQKADGTNAIIDQRIKFDPADHVAAHQEKLNLRQQQVNFMRANQFSGPQP